MVVFSFKSLTLLLLLLFISNANASNGNRIIKKSTAFVSTIGTTSKGTRARQRQQMFQLELFALHLFGDNNDDKDDQENKEEDNDCKVPHWVNAIKNWPRLPQPPITRLFTSRDDDQNASPSQAFDASSRADDFRFSLGAEVPVPLASLANVEALLIASGRSNASMEDPARNYILDNTTTLLLYDQKMNHDTSKTPVTSPLSDDNHADGQVVAPEPWTVLPDIEELSGWSRWMESLQRSLTSLNLDTTSKQTTSTATSAGDASSTTGTIGNTPTGTAAESILKEASSRIEYLMTEISAALSPSIIQDLILRASQSFEKPSSVETKAINTGLPSTTNGESRNDTSNVLKSFTMVAKQQGLDVREASKVAQETTKFASNLVALANQVLSSGFAKKDDDGVQTTSLFTSKDNTLFTEFGSARVLSSRYAAQINKAAEMGVLAGAIYQETIPRIHALGHSMVANGTSVDVAWMVTDTLGMELDYREPDDFIMSSSGDSSSNSKPEPIFVRTFTIRGFDASDESVDRERLLNTICTANPEQLQEHILVHSGLMSLARPIYLDLKKYIAWTSPNHRFVFNGHSVGGSIAILILLLLTEEFGVDFVKTRVLRVFTFGSPPVTTTTYKHIRTPTLKNTPYLELIEQGGEYQCDVLREFNLSPYLVYGFAQPWDPILRLFSTVDALYPLLGDMGDDGVTLYASGPPRSLRPIVRAIVESWEGWPLFRENFRGTVSQNYTSVGVQHVFLPEAFRYLSDRLVGANIGLPPVEAILRISSVELLPGLRQVFPLDVFQISFIPAAIRGFVHHFYPAYGDPFVEYISKLRVSTNASVSVAASKSDAFTDSVSRDDLFLLRNGANNKKRLTELGLGWTRKWTR